jgi:5'-nucleotidase
MTRFDERAEGTGLADRDPSVSRLGAMKILVTNDDGVASPGLHALAAAVADAGYETVVVAPSSDRSGAGASIGILHLDHHIDAEKVELPGVEGVPSYALDGPPGLCVLAARLGGFGDPPDLVVSGINPGCNTGRSVLHSGTVGAALTAANFGGRGLAVSIDTPGGAGPSHWASAAAVGAEALGWLVDAPDRTVLNVNVPDLPLDDVLGASWATLAPFGTVRSAVVESPAAGGRGLQMELQPHNVELPPDCDTALVKAGYVAMTTITGVQATEPVDVGGIVGQLFGEGRRTA